MNHFILVAKSFNIAFASIITFLVTIIMLALFGVTVYIYLITVELRADLIALQQKQTVPHLILDKHICTLEWERNVHEDNIYIVNRNIDIACNSIYLIQHNLLNIHDTAQGGWLLDPTDEVYNRWNYPNSPPPKSTELDFSSGQGWGDTTWNG